MCPVAEEEGHFDHLEFRHPEGNNAAGGEGGHVYRPQAGAFGEVAFAAELSVRKDLDLHRTAAVLVDRFGEFGGTDVVLVHLRTGMAKLDRHGSGFGSRPQGNQPEDQ